MKSSISINLRKDELIIKIAETAEMKDIKKELKEKIPELKNLYKEDKTPIMVVGRVLKNKEMEEIQKMIQSAIDVQVDFESSKSLGLYGIKKTFNKQIQSSETKFYKCSLRSGQKIEYEGSVVVIGDVNAGAEIIAGENIVVLGALRGLAHAGAKGNNQAIIAANLIDSPQIRISNQIKEKSEEDNNTIKNYAYINENDEIIFDA